MSHTPETDALREAIDMRRGGLLAAGFVWAECCAALDRGEDPREMFVGAIVERVLQFLQAATDHNN